MAAAQRTAGGVDLTSMDSDTSRRIRLGVRAIADYPRAGVTFRDITPLLGDARTFRLVVDELVEPWRTQRVDRVAGIEARGFILAGAIAHQLGAGFVPIRKKGKLPYATVRVAYSLEYGLDEIEMHRDALNTGERILLVDDLIATGGTAEAAVKLLRSLGAQLLGACFIVELPDLGGAARLAALEVPMRTLVAFHGQ
jgi:adenine phosphoribosyltransferase